MIKQIVLTGIACLLLSGCMTPEEHAKAHAAYLATHVCNTDAAYAAGINAGKINSDMAENFAAECKSNSAAYNKSYANGYRFGLKNATLPPAKVIYNQEAVTTITHASGTNYMCLKDKYNGKKTCGYDCKESFADGVVCGTQPGSNCIESFDHITCGLNCEEAFGMVKCDKKDT